MFCPNCGTSAEEWDFCIHCGSKLTSNNSQSGESAQGVPRPVAQHQASKTTQKKGLSAGCVILAIVIGLTLLSLIAEFTQDESSTTSLPKQSPPFNANVPSNTAAPSMGVVCNKGEFSEVRDGACVCKPGYTENNKGICVTFDQNCKERDPNKIYNYQTKICVCKKNYEEFRASGGCIKLWIRRVPI